MLIESILEKKCCVNKDLEYEVVSIIRHQVCNDLPVECEYEGRFYCILHSPDKDKDKKKMQKEIFRRLEKESYDFRGVWFPFKVDFSNKTFAKAIDFSYATFVQIADFNTSTFIRYIKF